MGDDQRQLLCLSHPATGPALHWRHRFPESHQNRQRPGAGSLGVKMVSLPALCTLAAWLAGFEGRELGLMFLFFASPTAAASFVMVKALGGNDRMAANIIALTTLLASVTVTAGVFILQSTGLA